MFRRYRWLSHYNYPGSSTTIYLVSEVVSEQSIPEFARTPPVSLQISWLLWPLPLPSPPKRPVLSPPAEEGPRVPCLTSPSALTPSLPRTLAAHQPELSVFVVVLFVAVRGYKKTSGDFEYHPTKMCLLLLVLLRRWFWCVQLSRNTNLWFRWP